MTFKLFRLFDISVKEVSLVDHGMIDEDFTERKNRAAVEKRTKGVMWLASVVKKMVTDKKISAEVLAEKTGIGPEDLKAIDLDTSEGVEKIRKVAVALGLRGAGQVIPTTEDKNMTKEEIEALVKGLLEPVTQGLNALKADLDAIKTQAPDGEGKARDEKVVALEKSIDELKGKLDEAGKKLDEAVKAAEEAAKKTTESDKSAEEVKNRLTLAEKVIAGSSKKELGQEDGNGKKSKFPSVVSHLKGN